MIGTKRGLSIIEIIVALGLISMVALAVIGVFSKLMTSSSKTADQAAGELLARAVLDKSIRSGPPDWGGLGGGGLAAAVKSADSSSSTQFFYRIDAASIPGSDHALGSLYRVDVLVSWGGSIAKTSQIERGKLWVERSRLTYVEDAGP